MVQIGRKLKKFILGNKYTSRDLRKKLKVFLSKREKLANLEFFDQLAKSERLYVDPCYRPESKNKFDFSGSDIDLLAFYLPQFHPFPENEAWWGKGFTEWTNVTRARPQFSGHYQPHLPADLGFYDLRVEETMERQINLAKSYGISGFVFHYYWFDGHRLMERPLDQFLARQDWDFKFCLCWANENFTRRWDGSEQEILLAQKYSPESDEQFIYDALKYLRDPRYFTIDGRPVLVVYRAGLLPDILKTVECWRKIAKEELGKDLFLLQAMTFNETRTPESFGFDAGIQFPPHSSGADLVTHRIKPFNDKYRGAVAYYPSIRKNMRRLWSKLDYPVIPAVFPSWDNTARRGDEGYVFIDSSPDVYADWLADAISHAKKNPVSGQSVVVVNAWNEWAEGAHLEPDQKYGHAWLEATADTLQKFSGKQENDVENIKLHDLPEDLPEDKTAMVIHAYYPDVFRYILSEIPADKRKDIVITTTPEKKEEIENIIKEYGNIRALFVYQNKGRDVLPFLKTISYLRAAGYKYFIKIHTKKAPYREGVFKYDGAHWLQSIVSGLKPLLRNGIVAEIFENDAKAAIIAPDGHLLQGKVFRGPSENTYWLNRICAYFDVQAAGPDYGFVAGTMFAGRVEDYVFLIEGPWLFQMFAEETGQTDGTVAHALERFFGYLCAANGLKIVTVNPATGSVANSRPLKKYKYTELAE